MEARSDDLEAAATTYKHMLPKNASEHERLDAQATALTRVIGGRPTLTSLKAVANTERAFTALDIGCGTGVITAELGRELQQMEDANGTVTKAYGVDLAPVPALHERAGNVEYVQGNINHLAGVDPRFQPCAFNFVFHRNLIFALSDWLSYIRTCFSLLKPGGRLELQETAARYLDINGSEIPQEWKWLAVYRKIAEVVNIDILAGENLRKLMLEAGFVDVEEKAYAWHLVDEPWDGHPELDLIGAYSSRSLHVQFPNFLCNLAQRAGMQDSDLAEIGGMEGLKQDYRDSINSLPGGSHTNFYVVCGRKPLA